MDYKEGSTNIIFNFIYSCSVLKLSGKSIYCMCRPDLINSEGIKDSVPRAIILIDKVMMNTARMNQSRVCESHRIKRMDPCNECGSHRSCHRHTEAHDFSCTRCLKFKHHHLSRVPFHQARKVDHNPTSQLSAACDTTTSTSYKQR